MITVMFDGWFSSAYNIIEMIKNNPDKRPIKIIGSHHKEMGYKVLCDDYIIRPDFEKTKNEIGYGVWIREICKSQKVDIIFVCKYMNEISRIKDEIESNGTKVVIPEWSKTCQLSNKITTYGYLCGIKSDIIPNVQQLHDLESFIDFKSYMKEKQPYIKDFCIKPINGTGGQGIHKISDILDAINFKKEIESKEYMIMPWIDGEEISVDCLRLSNGKLLSIPRYKYSGTRVQEIKCEKEILDLVEEIDSELDLDIPYNIQFKKQHKSVVLLEVNPRFSGGIHLSCLTGINIPYLTVKKFLGEQIDIDENILDKLKHIDSIKVCNVERGIIV